MRRSLSSGVLASLDLVARRACLHPRGPPDAGTEGDRQTGAVNNQAGGSDYRQVAEVSSSETDGNPAADGDDECTACDAEEGP